MKKLLLLLALALMPGMILLAQSPQAFKYQAIARNDAGNVLSVWDLSLRVSLIQEGTDGKVVYTETHKVQTNIYGLINLIIGKGDIVNGDFSSIKWGENRHYIKIEMDIDGGEDYKEVGMSQLYAVPYALYAEEAGQLKQPEPSYKTSEVTGTVKSPQPSSGPRGTPNSKISSTGDGWLNALTGNVGIGTSAPVTGLHVDDTNGVLFTCTFGEGEIPIEGSGTRMMWYPAKAAFRVGRVPNEDWDNDSIGDYSVAMGYNTKAKGSYSTAMGWSTEATGLNSTAMGYYTEATEISSTAMGYNTKATGEYSTAMGRDTKADGSGSTAMGWYTEATGGNATAMGDYTEATGYASTAMGGYTNATAWYSTAMGRSTDAESYASVVIGRYNVGGGDLYSWVETDPLFEIGNGTSSSDSANALTVLKNGNVGIGTTSPSHILHVTGIARSTQEHWATSSDARVKENINKIEGSLAVIEQLRPVSYNYKNDYIEDNLAMAGKHRGFIAQEVKEVLPEMVTTCTESFAGKTIEDFHLLNTSDLTPFLVAAMQEQQEQIKDQQAQIDLLQEKIMELETRLDK